MEEKSTVTIDTCRLISYVAISDVILIKKGLSQDNKLISIFIG